MSESSLIYSGKISGASLKSGEEGETRLVFSFACSLRTEEQFKSLRDVGKLTGQTVQLRITGDQISMDFDEN